MKLRRQIKTKKETSALIFIAFLVVAIFIVWGFQIAVTFSKDNIDLQSGWMETQVQIQDGVEYAQEIEGTVDGRADNFEEYVNALKENMQEQMAPEELRNIAAMIVAGAVQSQEEGTTDDVLENGNEQKLPDANEDGWIIVDEITLDEEGNTQIKIQE